MAALVTYESDDEGEDLQTSPGTSPGLPFPPQNIQSTTAPVKPAHENSKQTSSPVGPMLGPVQIIDDGTALLPDGDPMPQSPYSSNRALVRDLTLPTLPNYNIPSSPPRSPIASTNAKFNHFMNLKKQGVHFNEKLSNSATLKNPSLMQKLMDFSDIDVAGQYATTLPKELWNPGSFPESAYKEELSKSQQTILKKREDDKNRGQRESVDFVPAIASGESSRNGTPKISQKSAAERIMAGLDRGKSHSPQIGVKRKTRFES
jgi:hypothetical protein